MMNEVTTAAREQATGITQVNVAVGHLDSITQQNAALVEEAAAATGALVRQAKNVSGALGVFRLRRNARPQASQGRAAAPAKQARARVAIAA